MPFTDDIENLFVLSDYKRNTPDEDLIADVKKVAIQLEKNTVTIAEYELYGTFHPSTLQRRFGSWFKVMEVCNLDASRSCLNISEEKLFSNLEKVWTSLGRQPKYCEMRKPLSEYSVGTYEKRFGSFRSALKQFVEYVSSGIENKSKDNESNCKVKKLSKENKEVVRKTKRNISDRLRFQILMRDGFTCKTCGRSPVTELGVKLHVDHIIPWSKGGETIADNLETKCEQCNLGKGNAFDC
ncbi:HNH endonuclease [Fibrobacter sp. UWH9]|uniref:homing endonuclease associated repeat-containing protein n=1 Tax=Fibrobacter sp. UWH9 TaxID=1896213 RepID=UPI0009233348|nr:HNH endonuclease [Fibrobacter sp. UWH9]SHG56422.1 HNH endonuclease [Fibrobacter sp. UWH9]